jgi:hypothetical protein
MKNRANVGVCTVLLLSAILTACSDSAGTPGESAAQTENVLDTTVTEALTPVEEFLRTVPAADVFGGEDFIIGWSQQYDVNEVAYSLDEAEGDAINEAIYERNLMTEEKLGIKIGAVNLGGWGSIPAEVAKIVQADAEEYDVLCMSTVQTFNCVLQGYLHELSALDNMDFTHPWWDEEAILEMYSHGTNDVYFVSGDINYLDDYALGAIMFNKKFCADRDIDPYQDVRDGTWTLDVYHQYLAEFGDDIDGDGKYTAADIYGVMAGSGALSYFLASAGEHLIQFDKEGNAYLNNSERIFNVADKVLRVVTDKNSAMYCVMDADPKIGWELGGTMFPNGHSAFLEDSISTVTQLRFSMEADFGILPFPKYDEAQKSYHSPLSTAAATSYSIPISNDDPETDAWVLEVMGCYSTDTVRYAAMETVLTGKSIRDNESEEMLDLIFGTKFYDLGFWGSKVYGDISRMVTSYSNKFVSTIESAQNQTRAQYETVKEYYSFE